MQRPIAGGRRPPGPDEAEVGRRIRFGVTMSAGVVLVLGITASALVPGWWGAGPIAAGAAVVMVVLTRLRIPRTLLDLVGGTLGALTNAALVLVTGGSDSPFLPLFGIGPVMSASVPLAPWQIGCNLALATAGLLTPYVFGAPRPGYALTIAGHVAMWVIAAAAVYVVIRRLERQRERLEEVDRLRTLFLRAVSHELRTPLTVIRGTARVLGAHREGMDPVRTSELLTALDRQSARLERLVGDLLDLDRLERGAGVVDAAPVQLDQMLRDLGPYIQSNHHVLEFGTLEAVSVLGDRAKLERVVENLAVNAVKHTPPGSRVRLSVRGGPGTATIVVEDDGPGVPVDERGQVFRPFVQGQAQSTAASPGTGIGLSLVTELVQLHGGEVTVDDSEELGGARFSVRLPRSEGGRTALDGDPLPCVADLDT